MGRLLGLAGKGGDQRVPPLMSLASSLPSQRSVMRREGGALEASLMDTWVARLPQRRGRERGCVEQ